MATSLGRRSPQGGDQEPPDWSPVTEPPPTKARQTLEIVVRGLIAVGVAALLWALGRPHFAIVLVVVATALTAASLLWPGFAAGVDRAVSALQRWAGRVLALVLVGGLQLFVFMPLWLILRLVRHDPLALGAGPEDETFWRPVPRGSPKLYRRPFAYERLPRVVRGGDRFPLPRLRAALGLVALLLLLDVGIGAAIDGLRDLGGGESAKTNSGLAGQNVPAGPRARPGACRSAARSTRLWDTKRYDPYLGWTMPDFHGRYVNVEHGVRRVLRAARGGDGRPLSGLLPGRLDDVRPLPARRAHDPVRVRPARRGRRHPRASRQLRAARLRQLAGDAQAPAARQRRARARPGRVLRRLQRARSASSPLVPTRSPRRSTRSRSRSASALGQRGPPPGERESWPRAAYDAWADVSVVHRVGQRLGPLVTATRRAAAGDARSGPWIGEGRPGGAAALAASIYDRGVDVIRRLAGSYGFGRALLLAAVDLQQALPGEEELRSAARHRPGRLAHGHRGGARAASPRRTSTSATALDGVAQPLMYDFVHTNELGARIVVAARSTSACARSCWRPRSRERARDQRLLPRLAPPRWCRTASSSPPPRRSASRAASTTTASRSTRSRYCLRAGGRRAGGIDCGRLLRQAAQHLRAAAAHLPARRPGRAARSFQQAMPLWLRKKLWIPLHDRARAARPRLPMPPSPALHRAPREPRRQRVLPVAVRGGRRAHLRRRRRVGHHQHRRRARATGSTLERQLRFPHSLGLLYSAFTYYCGFRSTPASTS